MGNLLGSLRAAPHETRAITETKVERFINKLATITTVVAFARDPLFSPETLIPGAERLGVARRLILPGGHGALDESMEYARRCASLIGTARRGRG